MKRLCFGTSSQSLQSSFGGQGRLGDDRPYVVPCSSRAHQGMLCATRQCDEAYLQQTARQLALLKHALTPAKLTERLAGL